jgi:hypothetical protein
MADEPKIILKKGQMLPGIAGICMFLMFMTLLNVYGALTGVFGGGITRYGVLALCSILGAGLFGLLRLKKWGWAIVTAGCVLLSSGYLFYFTKMHQAGALIQGIFVLLFFLYMVRPETRERLL